MIKRYTDKELEEMFENNRYGELYTEEKLRLIEIKCKLQQKRK